MNYVAKLRLCIYLFDNCLMTAFSLLNLYSIARQKYEKKYQVIYAICQNQSLCEMYPATIQVKKIPHYATWFQTSLIPCSIFLIIRFFIMLVCL